ncbi:G-protein coupled estrogen receptor 1-like [Poeciliopsis prolifica]|uniref:G-protein coupled estrogen receptor 1-like n=1 Tax=Poeciliopsis prolifica TaxID=188132 RepID=UPI002413E954|nr:G-protein coupled estrogen receptor 1-like [Poeciliopsis prolifica]
MKPDMDINMFTDPAAAENFTVPPNPTQRAPENVELYLINLFLSGFYTLILFPVGLVGNFLILVVNLAPRGRLSAPDLYFANLAAADLILVADSLIEVFNLKKDYYDNAGLCTFMNLFQQVNLYSSVFFLTWMSIDRYVALTRIAAGACAAHACAAHACRSCCLIWAFAVLLTLLPFAITQVQHSGELNFCFANVSQVQWLEVTLGFLLPLCILAVCYWRIAQVLRRSQRQRCSLQQRPRRQRALRMIAAAVLVFFICWLPVNVFISVHLLSSADAVDADAVGADTLWELYPLTGHAVRLAAFSNSCLNPLIYGFLGKTFRKKLRLFLQEKSRSAKLQRFASENHIYAPVAPTRQHQTCDTSSPTKSSSNGLLTETRRRSLVT